MSTATVIVIAEDEALLRMVAHDILTEEGYSVVAAANSDEALALLEARPDAEILFTDVKMPGSLDGYMLAHLVSKKHPYLAIIVTSGDRPPGPGDLPAGASFLPKPYSPSRLLQAIEDAAAPEKDEQQIGHKQQINLEPFFAVDASPSANPLPVPVQEPEK